MCLRRARPPAAGALEALVRLKGGVGCDDAYRVRTVSCPICNADVPMDGDEREGDVVYCAYCEAPLKVGSRGATEIELEEDF
jgi:hypothetical protein